MRSTSSSTSVASVASGASYEKLKRVWIWTESKEVMTAAVERGWNTFIFLSKQKQLAVEWSCNFNPLTDLPLPCLF